MNSKEEIVFTSISGGNEAMDELKENNWASFSFRLLIQDS
jgi:hypothetical protein